jgi:hypothetical protein
MLMSRPIRLKLQRTRSPPTAAEAKLKIMRIIAEKCKAEERHDFEFHQMQYSRRDRRFRIAPLGLIRFQ